MGGRGRSSRGCHQAAVGAMKGSFGKVESLDYSIIPTHFPVNSQAGPWGAFEPKLSI